MENCEQEKMMCDCEEEHYLQTQKIIVGKNAEEKLIDSLCFGKHNKILIVADNDYSFLGNILQKVKMQHKEINKVIINEKAKICIAETLQDYGQELVVAVGGEELVSICKYYSFSLGCQLIVVAFDNYIDITFSKFARLFDGVLFDIYVTECPIEIYVFEQKTDFVNLQTYYITGKYISLFDNIVAEMVFKKTICQRMKNFLKQTLSNYVNKKPQTKIQKWRTNTWVLIRLGQAMSFYNQTRGFCGGDYQLASLMQSQCVSADFLELYTIALKLNVNSYTSFFDNYTFGREVNVNKHIDAVSKLLKISPTEALRRIDGASLIIDNKEITKVANNYIPYIKTVLKKCLNKMFFVTSTINHPVNVLKKYKFDAYRVQKSFALTPCLFASPTTLHLIAGFGFMDKLLNE